MLQRLDLRGVVDLEGRLPRPAVDGEAPLAAVRGILDEVRTRGDDALRELNERFDGVRGDPRVDPAEMARALEQLDTSTRRSLEVAYERITAFHRRQLPTPTRYEADGARIASSHRPVDRVGCYVPGGRAAYPSTLLMTAGPARVAGVEDIAVCVPASADTGRVAPVTLAAAAVAGIGEVHAVGGAQAIAALAHGTESIRPVDVICGPGNKYVALAQREVAGLVGIASAFAGPSEVVVIADASVDPRFAAIDVVLQAEHGPDGLAWLICWDDAVADAVTEAVAALVAEAPRRDEITATLGAAGHAVVVDGPDHALAVADRIAPEHLELLCDDAEALAGRVRNAGAIFCGPWSPASVGDYLAGPSHVLPTHGSARYASALTVDDFLKHHHVISFDRSALERFGPHVVALAEAEGLPAHAESVRLRVGP